MKALIISCILFGEVLCAQTESEENVKIKIGGYVNWTAIYDSRQTVNLREGHFLLYPSAQQLDKYGNDINEKANFNILSIQTRLNGKIEGPSAFGAKTSGMIEAEFFGTSEGDVNGFRLRHAYINFNWGKNSLLIGQTWHPMFVADAYPQVLSFNTGVPFQPFSRNPQIRLTYSSGAVTLFAALLTQRDFTSSGPAGFSSTYLRNSAMPETHLQVQLRADNILLGAGGNYKILTPRLETSQKIKTEESIKSISGIAYLKLSISKLNIITEGVYGQNMTDLLMLGGYAVSKTDSLFGYEGYTNLSAYSVWTDLSYGTDLQSGVFIGYTKNLGSAETIVGKIYSRAENISEIFRISPRILLTIDKLKVGTELEYTQALYGKPNLSGKISSGTRVSNVRILIGTFFFL